MKKTDLKKETENSKKPTIGSRPYISTFLDDKRFYQTKNPVYVLKAFIEAHEQDTCPPPWALNFVAEVFKKFDATYGRGDLNTLFGFNKGKGQSPAYIEYFTEKRYKLLCMDVFQLVGFCGMFVNDACEIVTHRLEETSDYDMGIKLKKISEETIRDKYYKRWGKKFNNSDSLKKQISNTCEEDIIKFLKKFDKEFLDCYKDSCHALKAYLPRL